MKVPVLLQAAESSRMSPSTAAVYGYMREFFGRNDQLPPMEMVRDHMGWASANAALGHIRKLEGLGLIERNEAGKYRFTRRGQ